jgi:hypothetical protein
MLGRFIDSNKVSFLLLFYELVQIDPSLESILRVNFTASLIIDIARLAVSFLNIRIRLKTCERLRDAVLTRMTIDIRQGNQLLAFRV